MTGFESNEPRREKKNVPPPDPVAFDFGPLFRARFSNDGAETEDLEEAQEASQPEQASQSPSPTVPGRPPLERQLLLQFPAGWSEAPPSQGRPSH